MSFFIFLVMCISSVVAAGVCVEALYRAQKQIDQERFQQ